MLWLFLAAITPASPFTSQEMAETTAIGDKWLDCALNNLNKVLPNDFDPVDAIAAAAVDYCIETERYRHSAAMLFKNHSLSADEADRFYERQRRAMVRMLASQVVQLRSEATKARRATH